jgi:hypothetical protein
MKTWYSIERETEARDLPFPLHPMTVTFSPGPHPIHFYSTPSNSVYPISPPSPPGNPIWISSNTPEYLEDTDPFYQHLLGPSKALDIDIELTAHLIRSSTLLACSNGSFNPICGEGSHGWVISSSEKHLLLKGAGPVSGNPYTNSPYRAELSGIISLFCVLHKICNYSQFATGGATIYCDNKSA